MATAKWYQQELKRRGLTEMRLTVGSVPEAKATLADIRQRQKELRQIKREVNQEIEAIQQEYRENVGLSKKVVGVMGAFSKERTKGKMRARQQEKYRKKRDKALGPYQDVKLTIDDVLVQMDRAKMQLQQFIDQEE